MEQHLLMAQVDNPEIREGNKDVGVLQAPRQYVSDIRLSFDTSGRRGNRKARATGQRQHRPTLSAASEDYGSLSVIKCRVPVSWC